MILLGKIWRSSLLGLKELSKLTFTSLFIAHAQFPVVITACITCPSCHMTLAGTLSSYTITLGAVSWAVNPRDVTGTGWKQTINRKMTNKCKHCQYAQVTSPDKKENVQSRIFYSTYLYVNVANMVGTTLDKQISKFFQGKITVFKDQDLLNKSASFTPFWTPHAWLDMPWSHLRFLLFKPWLITLFYTFHNNTLQNDLQVHLRYRNSFEIKK